jgi:hypothetical protein
MGSRGALTAALLAASLLVASACGSSSEMQRGPRASLLAYADALAEGRADDAYQMLSNDAKRSISLEAFRRMVEENPEDVADIARSLRRPGSDPVVTATVLSPDGEELTLVYERGRWHIDGTGIDRYGQDTPRQALQGFLRAFERKRYDIVMRYVPDKELGGPSAGRWGAPKAEPAAAAGGAAPSTAKGDGGAGPVVSAAAGGGPPAPTGKTAAGAPAAEGLTADKLRQAWEGEQKHYISRIVQAIKAALPTARIEETEDRAAMPYGAGGTVLFVREQGLWKIEDLK